MEIAALVFIIVVCVLGMLAVPVSVHKRKTSPGAGALSLIFSALMVISAIYLYIN